MGFHSLRRSDSSTNIRLETTVPQKEETFQVVIDLIKNFTCFKAFTISADVPEIFMQQLWYSIKKVQGTDSYEFLLANKKCIVNAEVFKIILDICLRVKGVDFTDVPDDDTALTFLIDLESEPEPTKKKTSSKRRVKKKVTLSVDDNIISDDPDAALELAKSISQTEAEEAEVARQVHATHARIVTESVPESSKKKSGGRSSKSVVIQDTTSAPKSKPATTKTKLKGTEGSNEGTGSKPGVPDESTVVSTTSSEGTDEQGNEHSDDDNNDVEKDDRDGDADDEGNDHINDTQDTNDEDVKIKFDEEDIYKYKIRVHKDEDEEMINAEVDDSDKSDEEITDAAKADAKKISEAKDDAKKTELPPSSSSLYVSLGFSDQFLKLSSNSSLVSDCANMGTIRLR
ncbi:hypothetical protein Tco_0418641 [Tanacetum coccineum]